VEHVDGIPVLGQRLPQLSGDRGERGVGYGDDEQVWSRSQQGLEVGMSGCIQPPLRASAALRGV
jgi:hypothetical protein